jgi:hypothetical protein
MYFDRVDESVLYTQNRGQIIYEEGEVGQPVYLSIRFSEEEIVQYILVSIAFAFEEHAEDIRPIVSYFRPSNVVEEYGIPDAILTDMKQFEERLDVGTLIFYWEETGLLIYYSTIFSLQEGLYETGGPSSFAPEYLSEI